MTPAPNTSPVRYGLLHRHEEAIIGEEELAVATQTSPKLLSTVLEEENTAVTTTKEQLIRPRPFPNTILDRQALTQALNDNGIFIKPRYIDFLYEHLHRQNYPPLEDFVHAYKTILAENLDASSSDDDTISIFSSPGGASVCGASICTGRGTEARPLHYHFSRHKLPSKLLDFLANPNNGFVTTTSQVVAKHTSTTGNSSKVVIRLHDGLLIETNIMKYQEHNGDHASVSVSSQVGCNLGCSYCPISSSGFKGNLTAGEIVEQVVHAQHVFAQDHPHVASNHAVLKVTFMGSGEPLLNYNQVVQACRALANKRSWNLCRGRITVSTVGITPRIYDLTRDLPNVIVALGLHAPTQSLRRTIVPVAEQYPLEPLMAALDNHMHDPQDRVNGTLLSPSGRKRRMVMVEYVMMEGKTSSLESAHQLGRLTESRSMVVNLIPLIVHAEQERSCPSPDHIKRFQSIVASYGTICNVRLNLSADQSEMVKRQMKLDKHSFMDVPTDIEELGFWQKLALVRFQGWNKEALRQRLERRRSIGIPREIFATRTTITETMAPKKTDSSSNAGVVSSVMELVGGASNVVARVVAPGAAIDDDEEREIPAAFPTTEFRHHYSRRCFLSAALVTAVVCRILVFERRR